MLFFFLNSFPYRVIPPYFSPLYRGIFARVLRKKVAGKQRLEAAASDTEVLITGGIGGFPQPGFAGRYVEQFATRPLSESR